MCLLLFAQGVSPDFPLLVAANRDEFHSREAAPACWWDKPRILAGRDRLAGGTWLGIGADGRFAALTNFRDPSQAPSNGPSRGRLVVDALTFPGSPWQRLDSLKIGADRFSGFNLVFGDSTQLIYLTNQNGRGQRVESGIHGLSNGYLNAAWPKVLWGKARLRDLLDRAGPPSVEELFALLSDRSQPADAALPDTGVGVEWERLLAPLFIVSPTYGTRCSTVALFGAGGNVMFAERTFSPDGEERETRTFRFHIAPPASTRGPDPG